MKPANLLLLAATIETMIGLPLSIIAYHSDNPSLPWIAGFFLIVAVGHLMAWFIRNEDVSR